ncbi:MAG: endonuclease/exonuclease/phosphatase family protein [Clostridia bacterium]|nr:endonuclease/exonuclease/phosphatase family protein [Clostridia bacterium]
MKLMTFNLRCNDDPNGHSIAERAFRIFDIIKDYEPDICGFQEVVPQWMEELKVLDDRFDHYESYTEGNGRGEIIPIYWRKDRYELVDQGYFWLSKTPEVPSVGGWGGGFGLPRSCTYVALKEIASGKIVHYYNTHFDGSTDGNRESAQVIIRRARALGLPRETNVFCTADFNFHLNSTGWHSMRSFFKDVREEIAPENFQGTLNIYQPVGQDKGRLIDFVFYSGDKVVPKSYEVITRLYDGLFPSDHYGIQCEFDLL